jgi:ribonuclease H / adenosylcobalamin/alpha-ribazole phosphatase
VRAHAHIDGGARPTNPGHAGFAVVIYLDGTMHVLSRYIGWRSNNVAEYFGLISAVKYARSLGASELEVFSDSKLVVEQVHGRWRVKSDDLSPLNREARDLLDRNFPGAWSLTWVRREDNTEADEYCTAAIHAGMRSNPWVRKHMKKSKAGKIVDPFAR